MNKFNCATIIIALSNVIAGKKATLSITDTGILLAFYDLNDLPYFLEETCQMFTTYPVIYYMDKQHFTHLEESEYILSYTCPLDKDAIAFCTELLTI